MTVTILQGDVREVFCKLDDNHFDSCITDPPYHLNFMGQEWDGGDIAFRSETWAEVLRVLKPGAHLVAFAAPKNQHRMICAIEDAGFEIRDCLAWLFGSGFPKSHNVSKGIDRAVGQKGTLGDFRTADHAISRKNHQERSHEGYHRPWQNAPDAVDATLREYIPATDAARQWEGWGSALKPAFEPICLARKPLSDGTIAANVLRWGTGALNIDATRIEIEKSERGIIDSRSGAGFGTANTVGENHGRADGLFKSHSLGRWPANVVHDGSEEVIAAFPAGPARGGREKDKVESVSNSLGYYAGKAPKVVRNDEGSAARFFYSAKADADDRLGSKHPTVKPVDLIQWLCRLITPPKGTILDPFAGTGTTGEAAFREGFKAVLIEREAKYCADIERRMALIMASARERRTEIVKANGTEESAGPLFEFADIKTAAE
jgi:site-specific DNA-methyltransferase (adenine-specific)